jgi:ABC-2 type transport system permease protein
MLAVWVFVYGIVTVLGMAIMLAFGRLVFGLRFLGSMPLVAAFTVLSMVSMFSLGFIIASLAPTVRTAEVVGMSLYISMVLVSGATFPAQLMPVGMRAAVKFLPLTHVVQLLQGLWTGGAPADHLLSIAVIGGLGVLGVAASALTFRWE